MKKPFGPGIGLSSARVWIPALEGSAAASRAMRAMSLEFMMRLVGQGAVTLARRKPLPMRPFEPFKLKLRYS
jgi:hypothetical protein